VDSQGVCSRQLKTTNEWLGGRIRTARLPLDALPPFVVPRSIWAPERILHPHRPASLCRSLSRPPDWISNQPLGRSPSQRFRRCVRQSATLSLGGTTPDPDIDRPIRICRAGPILLRGTEEAGRAAFGLQAMVSFGIGESARSACKAIRNLRLVKDVERAPITVI